MSKPNQGTGQRQTISLVVPFYNEEHCIPSLQARLWPVVAQLQEQAKVQLVLVDDGSTDATYACLRERFGDLPGIEITIVQHEVNQGIGAAMGTAFAHCKGDIICTMDSDCTYAPEELPGMVRILVETDADVVAGSPYHPEGGIDGVPRWRLFLSQSASRIYARLVPVRLYCYTSFFRVYRREWAHSTFFTSGGFLGVTEIMIAAAYGGARIVEYPVRLGLRAHGESKMKILRVMLAHLRLMGIVTLFNLGLLLLGPSRRQPQTAESVAEAISESLQEQLYKERIMLDNLSAIGTRGVLGRA